MNFFEGVASKQDGHLSFATGPLRAWLPDSYNGRRGTAGGLSRCARNICGWQAQASEQAMPVTVYALEHLGKESVVIFDAPGQAAKLRAIVEPGFSARVGEQLHVVPDMTQAKLFDPESERAVPAA